MYYSLNGPDDLNNSVFATRSKVELQGLNSGKDVCLSVVAVGTKNGPRSQAIRCRVP